jgi:hypothetical protein
MSINKLLIIKITLLSKYPILSSWVENPPIAMVENEWLMASKALIPAKKYAKAQMTVRPK